MNYDQINQQLETIRKTKNIEDVQSLACLLLEPLGIVGCQTEELLNHSSVQREFSRFMPAQGFRDRAAAYTIDHTSELPVDIKLYWIKKTTKANLSWLMALTPNYEDNPEINTSRNLGIDIVVSENCESIYLVLSSMLKVRVLELNGVLSHTQREIFENWQKIGSTTNSQSENFKQELHKLLWKSFDFEPINRKFYQELVTQFDHLVLHLKPVVGEASAKMFAVRFIGRTLFLWFLRKKDFINPEKEYFNVSGSDDQSLYYHSKLESLFFEVLNTEVKSRSFDDFVTPFLNGGLFEPIETDFYRDEKLTFPEGFFTQFFDILNRYNFTVDEGTSEYEQVAVDPEMLGRVFENLLASINDETGGQARKSKGAFYTPREIVDYMCKQSLMEYLKTKLPETANRDRRIEELVTMDEATFRDQDHNKRRDWKKDLGQEAVLTALDELRILDPAVGSGAFPMGMLNLLVKVYTRIDTSRERDLATLKREILSRSLYGVDIDQMAIQISRLRAWLSILVDMESLKKIDPLPNLDFKFVCANTLIPLDEGPNSLFDTDIELKKHLIDLRDKYYAATRKVDKAKIRKEYLFSIQKGGELFASKRELQLRDYNPFNPLNSTNFYDSDLMHGVEAFDIVIGNPPYIKEYTSRNAFDGVRESKYYQGKMDLWYMFACNSLDLLKENGIECFIAQNNWVTSSGAKKMRDKVIESTQILSLVDFGNYKIFETAGIQTMIMLFKKSLDQEIYFFDSRTIISKKPAFDDIAAILNYRKRDSIRYLKPQIVRKRDKETKLIFSSSDVEDVLIALNKRSNFKLNSKNEVAQGIVYPQDSLNLKSKNILGSEFAIGDGVFVISDAEKKGMDLSEKDLELLKPSYTTKELRKWYGSPANKEWVIYTDSSFKNEKRIDEYPSIKKHLDKFSQVITSDNKPYGLHRSRDERFFQGEKIIVARKCVLPAFTYTDFDTYVSATFYVIKTERVNQRYLTGILNSKLVAFWLKNKGKMQGTNYQIDKEPLLEIPLFLGTYDQQKEVVALVDRILELKKTDTKKDIKDLELQIDQLVYQLYDLTEEEIKVIEKA